MERQSATYDMLERLRAVEIDRVRPYFSPGQRVLEIGGGSGYQAMRIASFGCEVTSIDVAGSEGAGRFFPVGTYDGRTIPFADSSFDVIFSSNVLEHVKDLPRLFDEMNRVLTPEGHMVHIVPTPAWRAWSLMTHPIWIVKRVLLGDRSGSLPAPALSDAVARRGWPQLLKRAVVPAAHGEYPTAISELYYFSAARWRRVFSAAGMRVVNAFPNRLFYSGYTVLPGMGIKWRERLSAVLGSACYCFVLERE